MQKYKYPTFKRTIAGCSVNSKRLTALQLTFIVKPALKRRLNRLSFRTGLLVLALCIPCYIFSFAQMALPFQPATKGILWFIFFGLAKTTQYAGLTIIGVEGITRLKTYFKQKQKKFSSNE